MKRKRYSNSEKIADSYLEEEEGKLRAFPALPFRNPFVERIDALSGIEDKYERLRECVQLQDEMREYLSSEKLALDFMKYYLEMEELAIQDISAYESHPKLSEHPWSVYQKGYSNGDISVDAGEFFEFVDCSVTRRLWYNYIINFLDSAADVSEVWKDIELRSPEETFSEETIAEIRKGEETFFRKFYRYCKACNKPLSQNLGEYQRRIWTAEGALQYFSESENVEKLAGFITLLRETIDLSGGKLLREGTVWTCIQAAEYFFTKQDLVVTEAEEPKSEREEISYVSADFSKVIKEKVVSEDAFAYAGLVFGYSFEGQDLSKADTESLTFRRCNLKNTGARINLERQSSIYFIAGKPIDYSNLCGSIFQGCTVTGFDPKKYTFSGETFDKDFLKAQHPDFYIDDSIVPRNLIDAIYRRENVPLMTLLHYQAYLSSALMERATEANKESFFYHYLKWTEWVEKERKK